jgi:hypothetical protein
MFMQNTMHCCARYFVLPAVALGLLVAGCDSGPEMGQVSGTVTLDGQPVRGLEVSFEPVDPSLGTTAIGYTQEDGSYALHYPGEREGAPVGEYIVRISGGDDDDGPPISIPSRYNRDTELRETIEAGDNPIDFPLESE